MTRSAPDVDAWPLVNAAAACAADVLGHGTERWRHCQGVAERAASLVAAVPEPDRDLLVAAAWVHDIGCADMTKTTGFHPIDGGRYLRDNGFDDRLAALVAHHSGARFVAHVRGLDREMSEFPYEETPVADALTYADQTVGPGGRIMQLHERISDVLRRHGTDSPNARAHPHRGPFLFQVEGRVLSRLP